MGSYMHTEEPSVLQELVIRDSYLPYSDDLCPIWKSPDVESVSETAYLGWVMQLVSRVTEPLLRKAKFCSVNLGSFELVEMLRVFQLVAIRTCGCRLIPMENSDQTVKLRKVHRDQYHAIMELGGKLPGLK